MNLRRGAFGRAMSLIHYFSKAAALRLRAVRQYSSDAVKEFE